MCMLQSKECCGRCSRLALAVAAGLAETLQAHRGRVHAVERGQRGSHGQVRRSALLLAQLRQGRVSEDAPLRHMW